MNIWVFFAIVIGAIAIFLIVTTILGKRAQKKQDEQRAELEAHKQNVTMLVIDKKHMKFKDAGFPPMVTQNVNKLAQRSKIYVVKAKVGPRIMTFITEKDIFEVIPVKKEIKATISGLYIMSVRGIRGNLEVKQQKKKKESKIDSLLKKGRGEA